jgi:alpha-amylase
MTRATRPSRSLTLIFKVHEPFRLRSCSVVAPPADGVVFEEQVTAAQLRALSERWFLPANRKLLELVSRHRSFFRCAFFLSGPLLAQLPSAAPGVVASFREIVSSGNVELLGGTSHHTFPSILDSDEFATQISLYQEELRRFFGVAAEIFVSPELNYPAALSPVLARMGFRGVVSSAPARSFDRTGVDFLGLSGAVPPLLIADRTLSTVLTSQLREVECPLHGAEQMLRQLEAVVPSGRGAIVCIDYAALAGTDDHVLRALESLGALIELLAGQTDWSFTSLTECLHRVQAPPAGKNGTPLTGVHAWGAHGETPLNEMQRRALRELRELAPFLKRWGDAPALETWRRFLCCDHIEYMRTCVEAGCVDTLCQGPYESPYDAFINFMNALRAFRRHISIAAGESIISGDELCTTAE